MSNAKHAFGRYRFTYICSRRIQKSNENREKGQQVECRIGDISKLHFSSDDPHLGGLFSSQNALM